MRKIVFIISVCMLAVACGKPKFIPEKDMAAIMTDIFMVNSYSNINITGITADTLDIYTPVLDKYGYRISDLRYTLDEMSKRKSSRLTHIVDAAISELNDRTSYLKARERMFMKMDTVIMETFLDTVFRSDTTWRIDKKNTKLNNFSYRVTEGIYTVSYGYLVDTMTKTARVASRYSLFDTTGRRISNNTFVLSGKGVKNNAKYSFEPKEGVDSLSIQFMDNIERITNPKVTVDSVYITYLAPMDTLRRKMIIKLTGLGPDWYKKFENAETEKDSLALDVQLPERDSTGSVVDVR